MEDGKRYKEELYQEALETASDLNVSENVPLERTAGRGIGGFSGTGNAYSAGLLLSEQRRADGDFRRTAENFKFVFILYWQIFKTKKERVCGFKKIDRP